MTSASDRMMQRYLRMRLLQEVPATVRLKASRMLTEKYGEKHRKYHTPEHILFCFVIFDLFRHLAEYPDELEVAIVYHDAIYGIVVPARQNEERSAALAEKTLSGMGLTPSVVSRVAGLIMATTHDHAVTDSDQQLMVDVDLASLGVPWKVFLQNNENIRKEYEHVPESVFRERNSRVLRELLRRPSVYYHRDIEKRFGAQARENLVRWLNRP